MLAEIKMEKAYCLVVIFVQNSMVKNGGEMYKVVLFPMMSGILCQLYMQIGNNLCIEKY